MIDAIFCNLDRWRHFPNYQLERRADIFFSVYLAEVISEFTRTEIKEPIIPEFPIHLRTIGMDRKKDDSVKVDYFCVSKDLSKSYFVELKTDNRSVRDTQNRYLDKAKNKGLHPLLEGIRKIFKATGDKQKYYHLLSDLEKLNLLSLPKEMHRMAKKQRMSGLSALYDKIAINPKQPVCDVIFVKPNGDEKGTIDFVKYASVVDRHDDKVSKLFSISLKYWAQNKAGYPNL